MKFALDHIGIAVETLEKGQVFYKALGLTQGDIEEVPTEKVRVGMWELENDCRVELLQPTNPDGPVAKFISKRGPGIHHLCFRVEGIDKILKSLKAAGVRLINEEPRPGAHGCRVAFIHPESTGGVLIELSEHPR